MVAFLATCHAQSGAFDERRWVIWAPNDFTVASMMLLFATQSLEGDEIIFSS
jgi:hypothetical protein